MRWAPALLLAISLATVAGLRVEGADGGDPAAAERQYRIARRLAAAASPEAGPALRKVFELDPTGPLADDALLEEALLFPLADWADEVGRLDMLAAPKVRSLMDRVLEEFPGGDRALEARYRKALLYLEPVPGHDPSRARANLIEVATSREAGPWSGRARLALAWLLEREGRRERAGEARIRIVVDAPASETATRARVALGRTALLDGALDEAARWLQAAMDAEPVAGTPARQLRECAVRRLLEPMGARAAQASTRQLAPRSPSGLAATPTGGLWLAERREGRVTAYATDGSVVDEWSFDTPGAVVTDERGRGYVAASDAIYRLDADGAAARVASAGDYGPASAVAAGWGGFWVVDRRGQRIGRIEPGAPAPREIWQGRGSKLIALVWDGRRLVALDGRSRSLVAITPSGAPRTLGSVAVAKPTALTADPSGRLAVLDARAGEVLLLDGRGAEVGRFSTESLGMARPAAMAYGLDGVLHLFDESSGTWVRRP